MMVLAALAAIALQANFARAGTLGGIAGVVTDTKTGAPVAGVRLQITSPSQSITTTTDAHGHYIALSLEPDQYTVTASKDGYSTESFATYSVFADQTQQYDFKIDPSSTM
jgi:hypothetical protein